MTSVPIICFWEPAVKGIIQYFCTSTRDLFEGTLFKRCYRMEDAIGEWSKALQFRDKETESQKIPGSPPGQGNLKIDIREEKSSGL